MLVVDDEPTVRMLITDVLDELGYAVLEAGDGASALDVVLASTGKLDMMVTDVGLAGMNGLSWPGGAGAAAAAEGAVHHRVCREQGARPGPARAGHAGADQAVRARTPDAAIEALLAE